MRVVKEWTGNKRGPRGSNILAPGLEHGHHHQFPHSAPWHSFTCWRVSVCQSEGCLLKLSYQKLSEVQGSCLWHLQPSDGLLEVENHHFWCLKTKSDDFLLPESLRKSSEGCGEHLHVAPLEVCCWARQWPGMPVTSTIVQPQFIMWMFITHICYVNI